MPVAAAIVISGWQYVEHISEIASTGSRGFRTTAVAAEQLVQTQLAGVVAFGVILAVAWMLAAARAVRREGEAMSVGVPPGILSVAGAVAVTLAVGVAAVAMNTANQVGVGFIVQLSQIGGVAVPAAEAPRVALPPAAYAGYVGKSGRDMAFDLEWLITSRTGGMVLGGLLVLLGVLSGRIFSHAWASPMSWTLARSATALLLAAAIAYAVHLQTGARWLRSVIDG